MLPSEDRPYLLRYERKQAAGTGHVCLEEVFFFHYLGTVRSAMPDAHIFHHTNYISGVKTSSTLILCSILFIILSKLISYYALRMKKSHISAKHIWLYYFTPLELHMEFILSSVEQT